MAHIVEYYRFLVNPIYDFKRDEPLDFKSVLGLYFFTFFLVIVIASPLMSLVFGDDMSHAMEDIGDKIPKGMLFLMAVILMPIIEELIFRAQLRAHIWSKVNFGYPFYFTAALFAVVHLSNISMPPEKWYLGPVLVLPQLILGLLFGYVRVRNTIWMSIFCHVLHNGLTMTAFFLMPQVN